MAVIKMLKKWPYIALKVLKSKQESDLTSMLWPSFKTCSVGTNSTIWSVTARSQPISFLHLAFFSGGSGSSLQCSPNTEASQMKKNQCNFYWLLQISFKFRIWNTDGLPERFVIALDKASAEETPLPEPDMSSPRRSLANFSFINCKSNWQQHIDTIIMFTKFKIWIHQRPAQISKIIVCQFKS
jgi:hypothetical protein